MASRRTLRNLNISIDYKDANYCPKCNSRYLEADSGDGQKKQFAIPIKVLHHLPFVPRIQRLYLSETYAKQITWHKEGKRYNPDKLVHPAHGEAWVHFDKIHHDKVEEARNVRVALATDGFNPYGLMAAPYSCWPVFVIPLNLPPVSPSDVSTYFVVDNSWARILLLTSILVTGNFFISTGNKQGTLPRKN